jgi:glycosyltransferase involved in cell wall biosynthesis
LKKRVLQLIETFNQGGTERQAVQLTRLLHESNRFEVSVACLGKHGPLLSEVERLNLGQLPEYPLNSLYNRNAVKQARRFARYLRERKIDLVHAHDFYTNIFGMSAAALARVPVRIASRRETEGLRSGAQRWVERRAYNLAHAVVANAEAVRRQVIREGVPARKIVTVYNGLDVARLTPPVDFRREEVLDLFGLPREGRRFVTIVANMRHTIKDQRTFLRAARRVRDEVPEAAFVLAGEGEQVEPLRAVARELRIERDAFFIGRCARVAELLALSDVCVLSSKGIEGFSNAIIEYMAVARPVVATDVGGAREQIVDGETGYIVQPGDDEAMAKHIVSLLRDPKRAREMGLRGRRIVEEKFSCEAQLERTEKLYEQLLSGKAEAPLRQSLGREPRASS